MINKFSRLLFTHKGTKMQGKAQLLIIVARDHVDATFTQPNPLIMNCKMYYTWLDTYIQWFDIAEPACSEFAIGAIMSKHALHKVSETMTNRMRAASWQSYKCTSIICYSNLHKPA